MSLSKKKSCLIYPQSRNSWHNKMSEVFYREYKSDDLTAVKEILKNDLGYDVPYAELEDRINRMLLLGNYKIFVACNSETVVGFIGAVSFIAFEVKNEALKIIALAVSEKYRGQGIGTNLLKTVERFAEDNSISVILINSGLTRKNAHRFYESRGYSKRSFGFTKNI